MKKSLIAAAIAAASLAPVAAVAQDAAATAVAPTVGAKVFGPEGNEVGTVESVQGDVITVSTGTARAGLPKSAFAVREKGLTIGMTKAQLEAAISGAAAQTDAAKDATLVVGAAIKSSDGVALGTVSKVEGDDVTVTLSDGSNAVLKKSYIGLTADQSLALGMTAADFAQATQAAGTAQASADASAPPSSEENAATVAE
ncbi:hypothetical protein [Novosphingobium endophyticum]|nr:hypothetical protein [Novosphingobium endophyticum]